MKRLFEKDELKYIFKDLYLVDICLWLQQCPEDALTSLGEYCYSLCLHKNDTSLPLLELEQYTLSQLIAHDAEEEEEDETDSDDVSSANDDSTDETDEQDDSGGEDQSDDHKTIEEQESNVTDITAV